ncbi:MAG: hypothetical protein IJX18_02300 [Clostridia bacterium]|nr:hypothetical protein [Clostridia bacterium]
MEIDIISFTDGQFARLTDEQLIEVKEVQLKKNKLLRNLEKAKSEEKYRLLKNGVLSGSSYQKVCDELQTAYDEEVENLRDGLLFYLRFSLRPQEEVETPYLVDYSLTYEERIQIVRTYYETTYEDAEARLDAFTKDEVALDYLGEYYAPLYEIYYAEVNF